jgi:hypothetical protein
LEVKLDNFPTREGIIQKLQLVVLAVGGARARIASSLLIHLSVCPSVEVPILSFRTSTDRRTTAFVSEISKLPSRLSVRLSVWTKIGQCRGRQGRAGQGDRGRAGRPGKKTWEILGYGFQDMVFRTWDLNFGAWEILGYGFQDMVFRTWELNFGAWIFTLAVSKIKT